MRPWREAGYELVAALDQEASMNRLEEPLQVDALGVSCPVPVQRLRKASRRAAHGQQIILVCNDPLARIDVPNAIRELGLELLEFEMQGGSMRFTLRSPHAK